MPLSQKIAVPNPIGYYQNKYKEGNQAITEEFLSAGYTLKGVGAHFGKHYTTISRTVKHYKLCVMGRSDFVFILYKFEGWLGLCQRP